MLGRKLSRLARKTPRSFSICLHASDGLVQGFWFVAPAATEPRLLLLSAAGEKEQCGNRSAPRPM